MKNPRRELAKIRGIKRISEFGNHWLRVVINVAKSPNKGVTAFFDRRLRRKHESQS
jgi:hypothetical protein